MVDEHLPKVLATDVPELGNGQRPVEGRWDHVVPPNIGCQTLEEIESIDKLTKIKLIMKSSNQWRRIQFFLQAFILVSELTNYQNL